MLNIVAGGAGLLGSRLVNSLVDDGQRVIVIDNLATGEIGNLEYAISTGSALFVYADVAAPSHVLADLVHKAAKDRVARIFHLAMPAGSHMHSQTSWQTLETHALGTISLIEIALAHGAAFLIASSGKHTTSAWAADASLGDCYCVGGRCFIDESRRFAETTVTVAVGTRGLDGRIARLHDCYGPGFSTRNAAFMMSLFDAATADEPMPVGGIEDHTYPLTYTADAVEMLRCLMSMHESPLNPIDLVAVRDQTIGQIARAVATAAGIDYRVEPAGATRPPVRVAGLELHLNRPNNWRGWTPIEEGVRMTLTWLQSRPKARTFPIPEVVR